jgi:hypothetical protein
MIPNSIEVIIATANRPHLLEVALDSVVAQLRHCAIDRVVVSENGGNRASERVVERFRNSLVIDYRYRESPVPALDHWRMVFEESCCEYIAFLCDDDWWYEGHLRRATEELGSRPECASFFAASFFCPGEGQDGGRIYVPESLKQCSGACWSSVPVRLTSEQVHAAAWVATPFHSSTLVARSAALKRAAEMLVGIEFFNIDRVLEIALSLQGPTLFSFTPSAGVRIHLQNWTASERLERMLSSDLATARLIQASASKFGFDVLEFWGRQLEAMDRPDRRTLVRSVARVQGWTEIKRMGLDRCLGATGAKRRLVMLTMRVWDICAKWTPRRLRTSAKAFLSA